MAKLKFCTGKCDRCGEEVVWRAAESGSLSYTCQHCDFRGYAPAHTDAAKKIKAAVEKPAAAPVVASRPSPPESPPMPAKPAAKKTGSIWDDLIKPKEAVQ